MNGEPYALKGARTVRGGEALMRFLLHSRWRGASSISLSYWTGRPAGFCLGGYRSRWKRHSASRHWRMLWLVTESRKFSTRIKARSSPARRSPACSPVTASPSAWTEPTSALGALLRRRRRVHHIFDRLCGQFFRTTDAGGRRLFSLRLDSQPQLDQASMASERLGSSSCAAAQVSTALSIGGGSRSAVRGSRPVAGRPRFFFGITYSPWDDVAFSFSE